MGKAREYSFLTDLVKDSENLRDGDRVYIGQYGEELTYHTAPQPEPEEDYLTIAKGFVTFVKIMKGEEPKSKEVKHGKRQTS